MAARRLAVFIGLAVFGTLAFIGPGETYKNPNVLTRIALSFAILEQGTLRIDRFAPYTIDKAMDGDHFYADKAPGSSLLALPVIAAVRLAFAALHLDNSGTVVEIAGVGRRFPAVLIASVGAVSAVLSAGAVALATAAMTGLGMRLGASVPAGALAGLGFAFGTPIAGWGTTFFGHALSGGLLFLAFSRIVAATTRPPGRDMRDALLAGLASGLVIWLAAALASRALPRARPGR
jgi:hypothetical protein